MLNWAVGVITVPFRRETTFPSTIKSIEAAGFNRPHVFIDGDDDSLAWWSWDIVTTVRGRRHGNFGNWYLGLAELYDLNPHADRFLMFEDDIIAVRNLREYLESPMPAGGYCNLYTGGERNPILAETQPTGWFASDQRAAGALGLMFDNETVIRILGSEVFVRCRQNPNNGDMRIDGAICLALRSDPARAIIEYCHKPSLLQHTGADCSVLDKVRKERGLRLMNPAVARSPLFPGEEFDAMELSHA